MSQLASITTLTCPCGHSENFFTGHEPEEYYCGDTCRQLYNNTTKLKNKIKLLKKRIDELERRVDTLG